MYKYLVQSPTCFYNSLMRFSMELYYEPANLSVHSVGRIRLQINYYSN